MKLLGLILSTAALAAVSGFTLPRLQAMSNGNGMPQQQPEQASTQRPGAYSKTSPVLKAAVGLLTGGLNNLVSV